jgi:two-component system sensor histidine kinase HydH
MEHPDRNTPSGRRSPADETHDPASRRRPKAVDDAVQAENELRDQITDLAHELSGLLDGSLRFVTLARRALESDPAAGEAARQLERAGAGLAKMATLIARAMQPGTRSGVNFSASDEPLLDAVRLAVDMARPLAREKNIEIRLDVDPDLVLTAAGPAYTVLSNALRNAVEATEGDGRIDVMARTVNHRGAALVELTVVDDGPGPIEGAESRVFEYGYTTKPGGLGVGLAMLNQIAQETGGEMTLTRNPPTKDGWRPNRPGARFTFRFPAASIAESSS